MKYALEEQAYLKKLMSLLEEVERNEAVRLDEAADRIYTSMRQDGLLHVFATGHSHMIADELFYRAGGLAPINPLLVDKLMVYKGAQQATNFEREAGEATKVLEGFDLRKGDCLLLSSNSGINVASIEAALWAKDHDILTIGITSVSASSKLESRHPSGKRLMEVCDITIDNHAPQGDGLLEMQGTGQVTGGASSFSSLFIAQRLVLKVVNLYLRDGLVPPIFQSANIPGGDEHNKAIIKAYQHRIRGLQN